MAFYRITYRLLRAYRQLKDVCTHCDAPLDFGRSVYVRVGRGATPVGEAYCSAQCLKQHKTK